MLTQLVLRSTAFVQCSLYYCLLKQGFGELNVSLKLDFFNTFPPQGSSCIRAWNSSSVMNTSGLKPLSKKYEIHQLSFIFLQIHCLFFLEYHNSLLSVCLVFCFVLLWVLWPRVSLSVFLQLLLITNVYFTYCQGQLPIMSVMRSREWKPGALW